MPNIRQRNLEIPTVADETKAVATINPLVPFSGMEKTPPIQPKTITILGPPELTCPNKLFPSAAIVCLVYNVFVLKILVRNGDNNHTLTKALEHTTAWIIANRQPGGVLDLDECPESDSLLILKAPTITLSLSFTSGKRSIQKIEIT